jgi:hypothetical protein
MDTETCFWRQVNKSQGCWLWTGTLNQDGYGVTFQFKETVLAHRIAYVLTRGSIPAGMCVLHTCDVRNCVNPAHLFIGTRADNCRDRSAKGRTVGSHCYGKNNGKGKLSDEQIAEIRLLFGGTVWDITRCSSKHSRRQAAHCCT